MFPALFDSLSEWQRRMWVGGHGGKWEGSGTVKIAGCAVDSRTGAGTPKEMLIYEKRRVYLNRDPPRDVFI